MTRWLCRVGWHGRFDYGDGYRLAGGGEARCARCGRVGLVDSQGNLFATRERRAPEGMIPLRPGYPSANLETRERRP